MYYTVDVKRISRFVFGAFLALALTACSSGITPTSAPQADSASNNRPIIPIREQQDTVISLPEVCECVLRFDQLSIEQGMSQSSVHVIFQDSRGFLWLGTQD